MSKEGTPTGPIDWRLLAGYMSEQQALAYIHTSSMDKTDSDPGWLARIKKARSHVAQVSGAAHPSPSMLELAPKYADHLESLKLNPAFKELLVGTASFRFASIELAALRCSQGTLNLEHVERLLKDTPNPKDLDSTVEFCLPLREDSRGTRTSWSTSSASYSTVLVSQNLNFRVAGMAQGDDSVTGRKLTAVVYGFGTPQISVSEYNGRYILINGHHRAYCLLKRGHKRVPCVVLSANEYFYKGPPSSAIIPAETVMSDNPPILSDFDSEAAITVPRRRSIIVINVHAEAQEVAI